MKRPQPSLRLRLAVIVSATVAGAALIISTVTFVVVDFQLEKGNDIALLREATRLQRLITAQSDYTGSSSNSCKYVVEPSCARRITASDPVEAPGGPLRITEQAQRVAAGMSPAEYYTVPAHAGSAQVRIIVLPTKDASAVMVGLPTTITDQTIGLVGGGLFIAGVTGILFAALIGWGAANAGLRPLRSLANVIEKTGKSGEPHDRVLVERDDELGRLGSAFNAMLDELTSANTSQRQLIADASHELRTPLTTLTLNFDLLRRGSVKSSVTRKRLAEDISGELTRLKTLVADLMELATTYEKQESSSDGKEPVNIRDTLDDAITAARRHWASSQFTVVDYGFSSEVWIPRERLLRLWSVLLDNAGKYSAGRGDIVATISAEAAEVVVSISDRGIGIADTDHERVFDRFFRSDDSRRVPGSGLGLAIAAQIAAAAGGSIRAQSRMGGGTTMTVRLPRH